MIRNLPIKEFFKYGMASGAALVVDFGLLVVLTDTFGIHYLISGMIGFMSGLAVVYLISIAWVFDHRSQDNRRHEFIVFLSIGLAGAALNELILWTGTEFFGIGYKFAKLCSALIVFNFNFILRKLLLFTRQRTLS